MTIIYSKNYSFRKKWELFIQKIIQLQKNYSTKYSFKKFENYSFKKIIHFFEKLIIAQGYFVKMLFLHSKKEVLIGTPWGGGNKNLLAPPGGWQ